MSYKTICFCKGNGCSDGAVCVVLQAMQSDKYFKRRIATQQILVLSGKMQREQTPFAV